MVLDAIVDTRCEETIIGVITRKGYGLDGSRGPSDSEGINSSKKREVLF